MRNVNLKNKKIVEIDNETNKILKYIEENPYSRTEQICKALGIRETSLYRMLKRYGMNLITIRNEAIKNAIQKFLKQNPNASLEDMANYFKISISILSKDMRRFEIKNPNEVNEEQEQKREILTYMRTHPTETQGQMANHFGLSRQGFIYRLNKYNISIDTVKQGFDMSEIDEMGNEGIRENFDNNINTLNSDWFNLEYIDENKLEIAYTGGFYHIKSTVKLR